MKYTIEELLALPDADLNALAAELRGWEVMRCPIVEMWCDTTNGDAIIRPDQWSPVTNRNQSGELLTWAASQIFGMNHSTLTFAITIDFAPDVTRGIYVFSPSGIDIEVTGNNARAETVAFCAAMLAMKKQ